MNTYNQTLLDFYKNNQGNTVLFGSDEDWRPPLFAPEPEGTGGILFIGFNPSMTKPERDAWDKEKVITRNHRELLKHGTQSLANFQTDWAYEKLSIFTTRKTVAERLKLNTTKVAHLDLYPFRKTELSDAKAIFADARKKTATFQATCSDLFSHGLLAINPKYLWIAGKGVWEDLHNPLRCWGRTFSEWQELDQRLGLYAGRIAINGKPIKAIVSKELRAGRTGYTKNILREDIPDKVREWLDRNNDSTPPPY